MLAHPADLDPFATRTDDVEERGVFVQLRTHLIEVSDRDVGAQAGRAGVGLQFAQNEFEQSGRACAIGSDDANAVAAQQGCGIVVDHDLVAEPLADVLEFRHGSDKSSLKGRSHSRYGESDPFWRRGYASKTATSAVAAHKGASEIAFKVDYVVFPSGSVYSQRGVARLLRTYYSGIGFDWNFRIDSGAQQLYAFYQRSFPPPRISIRSYGRRGTPLAKSTIYSRMAETAFDNFSTKIVQHFGIGSSGASYDTRPSSGYAPRTPALGASSERMRKLLERLRKIREGR